MAFEFSPASTTTLFFVDATFTGVSVGDEPSSFSNLCGLVICTVRTAVAFGASQLSGIGDFSANDGGLASMKFGLGDVEECEEPIVGAKLVAVKLKQQQTVITSTIIMRQCALMGIIGPR